MIFKVPTLKLQLTALPEDQLGEAVRSRTLPKAPTMPQRFRSALWAAIVSKAGLWRNRSPFSEAKLFLCTTEDRAYGADVRRRAAVRDQVRRSRLLGAFMSLNIRSYSRAVLKLRLSCPCFASMPSMSVFSPAAWVVTIPQRMVVAKLVADSANGMPRRIR